MNLSTFRLIAATYTPFTPQGELKLEVVDQQAGHLSAAGVRGAFVAGSTGEGQSLTVEERVSLAERWVVAGKAHGLSVIIHVGSNCQKSACYLAGHAMDIGADAIAAHAPYFFRPGNVNSLLDFLTPIAHSATDLPFYYYDVPAATKVRLSTVEVIKNAGHRIRNFVGVKYTNNDLAELQACIQLDGGKYEILYGNDESLAAGILFGAKGAVGSGYNFAAPLYRRIIDALEKENWQEARALQFETVRLCNVLVTYGYHSSSRVLLQMIGLDCGDPRPPLRQLTPEERAEIADKLGTFSVSSFKHDKNADFLGPHFNGTRCKQAADASA